MTKPHRVGAIAAKAHHRSASAIGGGGASKQRRRVKARRVVKRPQRINLRRPPLSKHYAVYRGQPITPNRRQRAGPTGRRQSPPLLREAFGERCVLPAAVEAALRGAQQTARRHSAAERGAADLSRWAAAGDGAVADAKQTNALRLRRGGGEGIDPPPLMLLRRRRGGGGVIAHDRFLRLGG